MEIHIQNQQTEIDWHEELEEVINSVAAGVAAAMSLPIQAEVGVVLVDNAQIKQINKEHRHKDSETDVISFALNDEDDSGPKHPNADWLLGDIYISLEKTEEQARDYGHSVRRELAYLTIHGLLHLLGYDHDTEQSKVEMRQIEEDVLSAVDLPRR
ncbi:rRNA maturation RNase YbeY [Metallumcola ferriviriculae]|uniref:Endoribonuclease YbeY n=1 Tax=Metallumcola ferriviriculae TaxID=3039180 RepID=A0AAU0UJN0_9FIRM|nr:rRNA maturation RNase YbeY [Desulfitibacteraceae bacterium MK1]